MTQPYTHAIHVKRCALDVQNGGSAVGLLVQVLKRNVVYCGCIAGSWTTPDGLDCWTVETSTPEQARFTVPVKQVRECGSADCKCGGSA